MIQNKDNILFSCPIFVKMTNKADSYLNKLHKLDFNGKDHLDYHFNP